MNTWRDAWQHLALINLSARVCIINVTKLLSGIVIVLPCKVNGFDKKSREKFVELLIITKHERQRGGHEMRNNRDPSALG